MKTDANSAAISGVGSWSEPMHGSDTFADCWFVMSICSPPPTPSFTSLASGLRSGGIFETRSKLSSGSLPVAGLLFSWGASNSFAYASLTVEVPQANGTEGYPGFPAKSEDELVGYHPLSLDANRCALPRDTPLHAFLSFLHVDYLALLVLSLVRRAKAIQCEMRRKTRAL